MSLGRRAALGVIWLGAAQVARRLSGLLITAVLARLLAPGDFGLVALATAVLGIFAILSEMGFASALIQRAEVDEGHLRTAFTSSVTISLLTVCVGLAIGFGAQSVFDNARAVPLFCALLVTLPLLSLGQVPEALLQRSLAFKQIAVIEWGAAAVSGVAGVAAAFMGAGAWALVVQAVVSALVLAGAKAVAARWAPRFGFSKARMKDLSPFGLSILGGALINHLGGNIDYLVIGWRLGAEALGFYVMAFSLAMLPATSISGVITRVMFPALSSVNKEPERLKAAYLRVVRLVSVSTMPVIVGLGVVAPMVVPMIYGAKWTPSIPLVQALTVVGVCLALNTGGLLLYATGRPLWVLGIAAIHPPLVGMAVYIATRWGLTAGAIGYAVTAPLHYLIVHIVSNRLGGVPMLAYARALAPGLVGCGFMATVCVVVAAILRPVWGDGLLTLIAIVAVGVVTYGASLCAVALVGGHSLRSLPQWITGGLLT